MIIDPSGTQADQMPMAFPRFSTVNHNAMTAGATIPMKLLPMPSINLLVSIVPALRLTAPTAAPMARASTAIRPVTL